MMEYKGYVGKVEFDGTDDVLHGEVVGIRDVVTFQGTSVDEVRQAFEDSVDDYLEFCRERREEPDKPYSGRFVLRIKSSLHRKLNMLAGASGESLNAWVANRLEREVAKLEKELAKKRPTRKPVGKTAAGRKPKKAQRRGKSATK